MIRWLILLYGSQPSSVGERWLIRWMRWMIDCEMVDEMDEMDGKR